MARTATIQTNFTAGETSPRLLARVDLDAYKNACKTLTNGLPFYHGGVKRRPGTVWVEEVKDSTQPVRMIPFIYSRTQSYLAVFNDSYIQFIKNGEFIESSPGTRYQIAHTYTDDELNEIRFAQFGNTVYITHPLHPPAKLTRTTDTSWSLANVAFIHRAITDQWFENSFVRFKIISGSTPFLAGDDFTVVVASGVAGTPTPTGTGNGVMVISALAGAPNETWTVECVYADLLRQEWTVTGSVSGSPVHTFSTNNYPTAICFYQQRLWLAGTPAEPQQIWASAVNDFTNLTVGVSDTDGILLQLASSSNDLILHLAAGSSNLLVMTYANEFALGATSDVYTPSSMIARPQTSHGANLVNPLRIGHDVVFCQRDGRRIRSMAYDIEKSANTARDLTVVSEHITEGGVIEMAFQQDPDFVVWMVLNDGTFLSLTYLDEQEVVAWAKHTTDGLVENVCTIPESNSDKTYLVVQREIDGVDVRYIEWIDYELDAQTDCAIFGYNAVATDTWAGLDHLEGMTVSVIADESVHPDVVVTGGSITLQYDANNVEIGLPYTTTIELLHPNPDVTGGTAQGRQTSIHEVILRLQNTVGCRVNGVDQSFLSIGDPLDTPPPLFTGDKKVTLTGWRSPNNILIEQTLPRPFTLLGVILKLTVND